MNENNGSFEHLNLDLDLDNLFSIDQTQLGSETALLWDPLLVANSASAESHVVSDENYPPVGREWAPGLASRHPQPHNQPRNEHGPVLGATALAASQAQALSQRPPLHPSTVQGHPHASLHASESSVLKPSGSGMSGVAQSTNHEDLSSAEGRSEPRTPPTKAKSHGSTVPKGSRRGRSGRGSKSGPLNRRSQGDSDDEVSKLSNEAKAAASIPKAAGLTDDEKLQVVEYLSQQKFKGRVTVTQISNFWHNQVWDKYKACIENLVKPTGGGDGDEDWYGPTDMESSDTEDEFSDRSHKRKRTLKEKLSDTKFSRAVLEEFLHSRFFELVHKRAKDDNSVRRERSFNSAASLSDAESFKQRLRKRGKFSDPDDFESDPYFRKTINFIEEHSQTQNSWQQRNLDLAERRERREEAQWRMQQQLQRRELRMRERAQAMEMIMSGDDRLKEVGYALLEKVKIEDMSDSA
ncbi:hypothetical protein BN946_scf184686.g6 [Trametes cinnabarina]|uniref:Uncharacterized protein n=1 Tax=Pycnoporus cinnabarinus TaxID=5643 RepID=A0A060SK02_PYCCI|nr:hypothetical protein BN946_scf184686.g6 [Trametes cinnabarina]